MAFVNEGILGPFVQSFFFFFGSYNIYLVLCSFRFCARFCGTEKVNYK